MRQILTLTIQDVIDCPFHLALFPKISTASTAGPHFGFRSDQSAFPQFARRVCLDSTHYNFRLDGFRNNGMGVVGPNIDCIQSIVSDVVQ